MDSPPDEPQQDEDELPHEVTLTRGFWMANTTVTQVLWQAVMGNNLGHFNGADRPVEKVSWEDTQAFIGKMNGLKQELKLYLPSEAQWEYACCAGSNTPFYWGEQIDSELVNFDGSYPYNQGHKSENRAQTVEVKRLPCNDWDLYQMHGNVWEWRQDWSAGYPAKPLVDPHGTHNIIHESMSESRGLYLDTKSRCTGDSCFAL